MEPVNELDQIVASFADKLTALLRKEMRGALESAPTTLKASKTKPGRASKRAKGAKRTAAEMDKLQEQALALIVDNPGKRVEELNAVLGTIAKELALPLRKLIGDKLVKVEGERRGTRYFATSKGAKA
jgi:hypothetical protein